MNGENTQVSIWNVGNNRVNSHLWFWRPMMISATVHLPPAPLINSDTRAHFFQYGTEKWKMAAHSLQPRISIPPVTSAISLWVVLTHAGLVPPKGTLHGFLVCTGLSASGLSQEPPQSSQTARAQPVRARPEGGKVQPMSQETFNYWE